MTICCHVSCAIIKVTNQQLDVNWRPTLDRLIRILRIINIIQAYPGIKARELAELCETSERNIYRDLILIDGAKIPITHEGHGKGYKFIGDFKQYPLDWNEEELNAFKLLPVLLKKEYQTSTFQSAYEKVMVAYSVQQAERMSFLSEIPKVIRSGKVIGSSTEASLISLISDAILSSRTIEAVYHTQSRDVTSKRKLDPYFLMPRKNRFYLIGYCHKNNEIRTFRLSRFKDVKVLKDKFVRDEINLEKYFQYTWSVIRGENKIDFKVKFSKDVARYIKEEEYNILPKFTTLEDGSLLFEVTVNDDREFLKWVLQYGPDAEIIEPVKYRIMMAEKLRKWKEIYPS
jgi:predicted DNA-binding transcriptional regulator YafY